MLTRSGVGRRLGRSIATVRRLEAAGELHPERDERGVLRFDPGEVECIARRNRASREHHARQQGTAESGELGPSVTGYGSEDTDDERDDDGAALVLAVRQRHAKFMEECDAQLAERRRQRRLEREDAEALRLVKVKVLDLLDSATERELEAALTPEELEALAEVLEA